MMWHEARKQERKIRGMLVDYKKRAERRKDYYEKIKADPTQFLQLHGRPCKIHLDPAVAIAGDSPVNMMPWQGNQDVLIDRFDVRAHLDFITEVKQNDDLQEVFSIEERHINYERYRILVQNDFLGVGEEKFLRQLHLEEQFGPILRPTDIPDAKPKKNSNAGAAIGYNYDEGPTSSLTEGPPLTNAIDASHLPSTIIIPDAAGDDGNVNPNEDNEDDDEDDDDEDSDIDFDLCVDVSKVDTKQAHEMNTCAHLYGMQSNDFFSFLTRDVEEAENLRIAREQEEEKAMYSGRKARRERRAYRDKKLMGRKFSPPSYASRKSPTYFAYRESKSKSLSKSRSRSQSPANAGQVTYITSFGGDEPAASEISKNSGNSVAGHSRTSVRYRSRTQKSTETSRGHPRGSGRSPVFRRSKSRSRVPPGRRRSRSWSRTRRRSRTRMEDSRGGVVGRGGFRRRSRSVSRGRRRSGSRTRRSLSRGRSRSHSPRGRRSSERSYNWRGGAGFNRNSVRRPSYPRRHRDSRSLSRSPSVSNRRKLNYGRGGSQSPSRKKPLNPAENKSPSPVMMRSVEIPAPPVITRYYGRNQPQQSSSELSYSSEDESMSVASSNTMNNSTTSSAQQFNKALPDKNVRTGFGNSGGRNKPSSSTSSSASMMRLTPQERLKKKMQAQLNRQFKADKRAERVRLEKVEQERIDRAEEMREISIKLRRRERQKRHQYYADEAAADDRYSSVSSRSFSSSSSPEHSHSSTSRRRRRSSHRRSRSRSRGRSKSSGSRGSKSTSESPETVNRRNRPLVDY